MIKLSLPGFFEKHKYVMSFLEYYNNHRAFFYNDRIIDSFYGTDYRLIWLGGRSVYPLDLYDIEDLFADLEPYPEIKIRHTFTNCLITEPIVKDYMCNLFVKKYIRPQDEVIINHPLLLKHFKKEYPKIPIVYSTTLDIKNIDKVNKITETNMYVVNYNYNNDKEYLQQLQHPNNIELICAEPCIPNCPNRTKHYTSISKDVLNISFDDDDIIECPFKADMHTFNELMQLPHAITNERLKELEKQGFENYKISGRSIKVPQWLDTILYYLALPKYIDFIREQLLNEWW